MLPQPSNTVFPELNSERGRIVAFVGCQTFQLVHVSRGEFWSDFGVVGLYCGTIQDRKGLVGHFSDQAASSLRTRPYTSARVFLNKILRSLALALHQTDTILSELIRQLSPIRDARIRFYFV